MPNEPCFVTLVPLMKWFFVPARKDTPADDHPGAGLLLMLMLSQFVPDVYRPGKGRRG